MRFWRNKDKFFLEGGLLCFEGKVIMKKLVMKEVVKKFKGFGLRKIYRKFKDCYSGILERIFY